VSVPHPVAEMNQAAGGGQHQQHPGSPHQHPAAHLSSPYPATFHETIVLNQPTTTSADILYDSINISQAYPTLTSSLGGTLTPLTPISMQEMKPSMFSPIIPESSTPFNTVSNGSPAGVSSSEYYSANPYSHSQYSSYGAGSGPVNYNYGAPSPGGLLTK